MSGAREPSEAAIDVAMAEKSFEGGEVRGALLTTLEPGTLSTVEQTRSLVRNKLRAAYAIDFPDSWGTS